MKKLCCLFLTLSMLLSMVPAAFAAPTVEAEDTSMEEILVEDPSIEYVTYESPTEEIIADETLPEDTLPAELLEHRAEVDARAEANTADIQDLDEFFVMPDTDALNATTYSVTVKVNFPQAATSSGRVRIALYRPAQTDETGFVTSTPSAYTRTDVNVKSGDTSASVTFEVPAGKYIPAVYSYNYTIGSYLCQYLYFNKDGSLATNGYTADPVTISSSKTLTITMPEAERTISGTVHFSSALTEDTGFELSLRSSDNYNSTYTYCDFYVAEGSTSFQFTIPLRANSYSLQIYNLNSGKYGYYDVTGNLSTNYDSRAYISLFNESVTDLSINGDPLLGSSTEDEEDTAHHRVDVTIQLPEKASEFRQYAILLYSQDYDELYDYNYGYAYLDEETTEISTSFYINEDAKFSVGYVDITYFSSFNWSSNYPAARYLSSDNGVTSLTSNAKVFTMGEEDLSISMDDTSNYKATGTLYLGAAKALDCAVFAMAEFENGEAYGARVYFPAGTTCVEYTIYIPASETGTFDHWVAEAASNRSVQLNDNSIVYGDSYTPEDNLELDDITMLAVEPNVTGTLSLPTGMTAPEGGLAFQFSINSDFAGYYYMAEGESSIDFSLAASLYEESENYLHVNVLNAPDNLLDSRTLYNLSSSDMVNVSMSLSEAVLVSGNVIVSDAAKNPGTTFRIRSYSYVDDSSSFYNNVYVTTIPGETTASYKMKVGKDVNLQLFTQVYADATGKVLSQSLYLQTDGSVSTTNCHQATLNSNTTVDFTFPEGSTISGTITLADGLPSGSYYGQVYARSTEDNTRYGVSFSFSGTSGTYALAVPADYTGTFRVYFSVYEGTANTMTETQLYYSTSGMTNYSDATLITAPADNINLVIQKAYTISGTVILPNELAGCYIWGSVQARSDNYTYSSYIETGYRMNYSIKVPVDYTGSYKLSIVLSSDDEVDGLITGTTLYLTEDGTLSTNISDAKEFTVDANGLTQDITVPLGSTYKVTLNAPDGFSGNYYGYLYLYNIDTCTDVTSKRFDFEGTSSTVSLPLSSEDAEANYTLRIYLNGGPGTATYTYYYYDGTSNTWVTTYDNLTPIDFSSETVSVTMPKAKTISGKLVSSQGDTIQMPEDSVGFSLYSSSGSYVSCNCLTGTDGSFTLTIPNDLTGDYRLFCYPYSANGSNVVSNKNYYYKSDATSSVYEYTYDNDSTYFFTIGEENISDLFIYVDTGYILSGTIQLGEDAILTSSSNGTMASLYWNLESDDYSNSFSISLYKDATSWTYSLVVPKVEATYSLSYSISLRDNATSNLYIGEVDCGTLTVSGDTTMPEVTLEAGAASINVTITSPISNYVNGNLYISTNNDEVYEAYFYLNSNTKTRTITITTAPDDTAETYQLYYYAFNSDGIESNKYIYVAADGSLTTNSEEAGTFTMEQTTHSFTLMEQTPYASGKIYLPECTDDTDFTIYLYGLYGNSYYIYVSSDTIKTDADGNKYVPYALYNSSVQAGLTYTLSYYLSSYDGSTLFNKGYDTSYRAYLNQDGEIVYGYYNATDFTIPESGTTALDFTLATWDDGADENILQSAHGINSSTGELSYTFTYPGATYLDVTFHDRTDCTVTINGNSFYPTAGTTQCIDVSSTNGSFTITVNCTSSSSRYYGFGITSIVPTYDSVAVTAPAVASVYSNCGSDPAGILADLSPDSSARIIMVAPEGTTGTLIAVIYNDAGQMLDVVPCSVTFENECLSFTPDFAWDYNSDDTSTIPASMKIMFSRNDWTPLMDVTTLTTAND